MIMIIKSFVTADMHMSVSHSHSNGLAPVLVHYGQRRCHRARAEGGHSIVIVSRPMHQRMQRLQRRCHRVCPRNRAITRNLTKRIFLYPRYPILDSDFIVRNRASHVHVASRAVPSL